jgi:aminoglycoside 6'-N-acetyltransferase I
MIRTRHVERRDARQWTALRSALWPDEGESGHAADVTRFFDGPPAGVGTTPEAVLVAEDVRGDASAVVGFVELSRRLYAEGCDSSPVGFLEGWYVMPEYRRQGIGAALVRAAEAWALALGCTEFASDALVDNHASAAAHAALGFEEVEVIRCFRKRLGSASKD